MTFISFAKEDEFDPNDTKKIGENKLIAPGSYTGEIIEAKNLVTKFDSEEIFIIKWKIKDQEINKRFKLWNSTVRTRVKAQQDLINLLKLLNINIFFTDNSIDFDSDALIGKQAGIIINQAKDNKDRIYSFIDSFYPLNDEKSDNKILEDTIGF